MSLALPEVGHYDFPCKGEELPGIVQAHHISVHLHCKMEQDVDVKVKDSGWCQRQGGVQPGRSLYQHLEKGCDNDLTKYAPWLVLAG